MKRAKRPPSKTSKGSSWGSFSSRHGPSNDDRNNDDCVNIEYSKQVKVFLPKKLAVLRRLLENAENESVYLSPIKENLDKMKSDMQALVQTLERSLVEKISAVCHSMRTTEKWCVFGYERHCGDFRFSIMKDCHTICSKQISLLALQQKHVHFTVLEFG
jgi:hypothetical protein